ncbi:GATA zinc finger domain-containing protein 14 [Agrilus planipennis]|uniref:GATA zinc finger domain-containing protein 14 n=1 Tax=Agrilus planipennis TaxID=224129 RepID=A0A1W4XEF5_AGRPL|nr:GATA zinc finger domain-containing protein 14 [Agrilus planipennis]
MSGYKRVNFYELCRLCATNQQKEKTHIFHEQGRKIQLQNKIQSCLSLKVCENDFLPKVVCSQCLNTLEECYTFKKECQTSETMLSSYFNNFRYTEDFKKSGKVYIKDTSSKPNPIITPSTLITTVTTSPNSSISTTQSESLYGSSNFVNVVDNSPQDISYVHVPNNVTSNANSKCTLKSDTLHSKVIQTATSQPQVAYNLNAVNIELLKSFLQNSAKNDTVANVTVNANGEIIGIGPIVNFDALLAQSNALLSQNNTQKLQRNVEPSNKPIIHGRKRSKNLDSHQKRPDNSYLEDSIIKIDLTESEPQHLATCGEPKSSTQLNKIAYTYKANDSYKNSTNAVISVPDLNPTQLVQKFINSSHIPQVNKLPENEPNQQVFSTNSNIGYASHINTSSINVMSNISLQNVNLNAINIPSSLSSNNLNFSSNLTNMNANTNASYNHNINQQSSTNNLGQNITNTSVNMHQNGISKVQNVVHRKSYSMNSTAPNSNGLINNLDLNAHIDSATLEKGAFAPAMNILNMNLTSANANLLNNLSLAGMNSLSNISNTNLNVKSEEEIRTSTSNSSVHNMTNSIPSIIHNTTSNANMKNQNLAMNHSKVNGISSTNVIHMGNQTVSTPIENVNNSLDLGTNSVVTSANNQSNISGANLTPPTSTSVMTTVQNDNLVKSHTCEICKKTFKRKEHLFQHVKLHTGFRPFRCDKCNKCFMRKEHLLRHMTAHSGAKNFTCDICDKCFSRNDNLLKHKKTHEKQSKFTCQVCQKHFVMKHYYLAHKLTHETDRCNLNQLWGVLKA